MARGVEQTRETGKVLAVMALVAVIVVLAIWLVRRIKKAKKIEVLSETKAVIKGRLMLLKGAIVRALSGIESGPKGRRNEQRKNRRDWSRVRVGHVS